MEKKYAAVFALFLVLFLASCATGEQKTTVTAPPVPQPVAATLPATAIKPTASPQQSQSISSDVKDLLDKSKTKAKNVYYKYKGPQTADNFFEFYATPTKIMYKPARALQILDKPEAYDSIFIDKTAKTAQAYCIDRTCVYKGKKSDLNYNDAYIMTVYDWIDGIKEASKVGEEVIDDRSTWKVSTNEGTLWLDTFYGVPLKAEANGKTYRFAQIAPNNVQDSDVIPS